MRRCIVLVLSLLSNVCNGADISFGANFVRGSIFESHYRTGAVVSATAALICDSIALIVPFCACCKEGAVKVHASS